MRVIVCDDYEKLSEEAASLIASLVREKPDCVLGLATGFTPLGTYRRLAEAYACGKLSFADVTSYNLDEYYPLPADNEQSYRRFMNENLFSKIDIDLSNTHVPDGMAADPDVECRAYDEAIRKAGGIDLQLLGIGVNGHIGFNEPADELEPGTHLTPLTESTIKANARFFASEDEVPKKAITMGMASILSAHMIVLLASGTNKHNCLQALLRGKVTTAVPATLLNLHENVVVICDKAAYEGGEAAK